MNGANEKVALMSTANGSQAVVASDEQLPRLLLHFARQDWFKTRSMNPHLFLPEMALEVVEARVRALVRK
ncbi:hypothetical protein D5043_11825 [Verminephrobacter eiseniae]|nr:hypothetical protein [Verminephrobacter eiseniae]